MGVGVNTWWVWRLPRPQGAQHCWAPAEPPIPDSSRSVAPPRLLQHLSASALLLCGVAIPGPARSDLQCSAGATALQVYGRVGEGGGGGYLS